MDCAFEETLHKIRDITQSALERAEASAKLVERLEEETKKLKELTDSFNEKRMQDEKEMEEIRLRMELEDKEKEKKRRLEESEALAAEADDALAAFMLEQYGKVKIFLGDSFYWGYPPRPAVAPVCSPTSPAETSLASCHESDEERVLRLANWPLDHPSPSDGPIVPVGERIDAAIKEIRECRIYLFFS